MDEIKKLIKNHSKEKGYDKESVEQKFLLLTEEVGEFAKAVRKLTSIGVGAHSKKKDTEEEAADVLYVLTDICNTIGVDIEKAFHNKMKVIKKRK